MKGVSSVVSFLCLVAVLLACKGIGSKEKPFVSQSDNFTVTFPSGAKEPAPQPGGTNDVTYSTTNGNGIYRIRVWEWKLNRTPGEPLRTSMVGAGAAFPLDDETKEITFQNAPALESYGWHWSDGPGPDGQLAKLYERQVAFQPTNSTKMYAILMQSLAKEKLSTKEANEFFASFKLGTSP